MTTDFFLAGNYIRHFPKVSKTYMLDVHIGGGGPVMVSLSPLEKLILRKGVRRASIAHVELILDFEVAISRGEGHLCCET